MTNQNRPDDSRTLVCARKRERGRCATRVCNKEGDTSPVCTTETEMLVCPSMRQRKRYIAQCPTEREIHSPPCVRQRARYSPLSREWALYGTHDAAVARGTLPLSVLRIYNVIYNEQDRPLSPCDKLAVSRFPRRAVARTQQVPLSGNLTVKIVTPIENPQRWKQIASLWKLSLISLSIPPVKFMTVLIWKLKQRTRSRGYNMHDQ